jgi:hypothetical protein
LGRHSACLSGHNFLSAPVDLVYYSTLKMNEIYSPNDVETQMTALQNSFGRSTYLQSEPLRCSRYSDCLRTGRPRGRISSPGRVKNFHLFISSRPALGADPTSYPMGTRGSFIGGKATGA